MADEKHENNQGQIILKIEITIKQCRRPGGTQKSKTLTEDFLGCVECSTNGNLLGEIRIFVPASGSDDAKVG